MFYLTTLNTFYLRLYGRQTYMVKDHSDREIGNLLPTHTLLFPINSKGSFICIIPPWYLLPVVGLAGTRYSSMDSDVPLHHKRTLYHGMNEWMNECLTTPQHENRSAIGCQNNSTMERNLAPLLPNENLELENSVGCTSTNKSLFVKHSAIGRMPPNKIP